MLLIRCSRRTPEQITDLLEKLGREVESRDRPEAINEANIPECHLEEIISLIVKYTGHDFSGDKPNTFAARNFGE
ncbi:hypothetical protein GC197_17225 [bacterium]|nr:hypothetical protein [bacterium]